ncbi:MAG: TetR/AcrR family transcriptional regulator [Lachnospiraceae bacterium]|nr:TetR/AcrR family transcriptional regulator [Lachnospiraceae bacterium]
MLREKILNGAVSVYKKKGIKFTMDDLAREISMSKKTIYTVFRDKKHLINDLVNLVFDQIKESEDEIVADASLDSKEKLKRLLSVMPETFKGVDFPVFLDYKDKYPKAYESVKERLESGWDQTLGVIREGIANGSFREVDLNLFQMIYDAAVERFLSTGELDKYGIHYGEALEGLAAIMISGIRA